MITAQHSCSAMAELERRILELELGKPRHYVQHRGKRLLYHVIPEDTFPDIPVFFGRLSANNNFFVSDSTPEIVRPELLRMEYDRLHIASRSYSEVVNASMRFRSHSISAPLTETLSRFFTALLDSFEVMQTEGERIRAQEDIQHALGQCQLYLRNQ